MAWDWDKIKGDASGILGAIGKFTPIGAAKGAIDMAKGNEAEIAKVIRKLLKRTPPGQAAEVVKLIIDRYKIDPDVAQRMVANEMADANVPTDPSGTADEGYRPEIGIESSAEDYYPEKEEEVIGHLPGERYPNAREWLGKKYSRMEKTQTL